MSDSFFSGPSELFFFIFGLCRYFAHILTGGLNPLAGIPHIGSLLATLYMSSHTQSHPALLLMIYEYMTYLVHRGI